jgi:hypothetical protein
MKTTHSHKQITNKKTYKKIKKLNEYQQKMHFLRGEFKYIFFSFLLIFKKTKYLLGKRKK